MAHKKQHQGPIPAGNQQQRGPSAPGQQPEKTPPEQAGKKPTNTTPELEGGGQQQDPKRRLGDYAGAGEHPRQQPSALNDGNQHSR